MIEELNPTGDGDIEMFSLIEGIEQAKNFNATVWRKYMFGIGMPELIIILVIILIIFGAGKLPEIGGGVGKAIRNFRQATKNNECDDTEKIEENKKA